MQRIKLGIIALAASATIVAPAESVVATTQSASSPTTAATCLFLCFDLYEDGQRVGHRVDMVTAAEFCYGVGVMPPFPNPLGTLGIDQRMECPSDQGHQRWVVRSGRAYQ
jgi:hypothetical protein